LGGDVRQSGWSSLEPRHDRELESRQHLARIAESLSLFAALENAIEPRLVIFAAGGPLGRLAIIFEFPIGDNAASRRFGEFQRKPAEFIPGCREVPRVQPLLFV